MAIRIPILTSFDPKGLKQANAQFAKLQTSVGSLGRNLAAAGVVIAGAFAMIGRSLRDAADSERVLAQTTATLKSTGTTANGTAKQIAALASSLQKTTAFNDEAILSGQNLLLTFKGIQNQAGAGNDIFDQASATMLDFARAMNTGPSEAAIKLGKALQDPTRGVTALRKSGVDFTKDQMEMIKALQDSGDLMGAQKIVLAELQSQFGGSAAAFAQTFTGQLESMNNELNDLSEEIGFMVMPAVTGFISELRALIPVIGPQLKAAIESVDFKALAKSVVDLTTFLITNADAIAKGIIAIFAISTAYKTMAVAAGIAKLATDLYKYAVAQAATGMTLATAATNIFAGALRLLPFVAVTAAIVALGVEIGNLGPKFDKYKASLDNANTGLSDFQVEASAATFAGQDLVTMFSPLNKTVNDLTFGLVNLILQLKGIPRTVKTTIQVDVELEKNSRNTALNSYLGFLGNRANEATGGVTPPTITTPTPTPSGGAGGQGQTVSSVLARDGLLARRETKLLNAGVSAGFAELITNTATTKKKFQAELAKIATPKGLEKQQAKFNRTAAGQAELAQNAAAAASAAAEAAAAMAAANEAAARAAQEAADREAAILAERERVYNSFLDSVKNTFGSIKSAIIGAFDLTQLGGSTNSITRNMDKLLTRLRSFATNVKSLATMGLNPALLQQIISAGPMAGARLAEGLAMGGAEGLSAINAGYAEFGALSGQIAQTGTESLFGTSQQQNVYNISVDGGVGSGSTIGKAIVDAIKAYERTSGAVWQGA